MEHDLSDLEHTPESTLSVDELSLVLSRSIMNRFDFAVQLKFFAVHGRFPRSLTEVDPKIVAHIAEQVGVEPGPTVANPSRSRTLRRYRAEIRAHFGFRRTTNKDATSLANWLANHAVAENRAVDHLSAELEQQCHRLSMEPPSAGKNRRIVRSAIHGSFQFG